MTARGIVGIDHALVGVRDLEHARMGWTRLGFTLSPRGRHLGWGTANYCVMFPRDYIELIGIVDPAQFTNNLDRFLAEREGLLGLAFAGTSAAETVAALAERGIAAEPPKTLGRQLELPEGSVVPRFELVFLPAETTPMLSAFVCHHLSEKLIRRAEWLEHANGARRLVGLDVVVAEPAPLAGAYARLLGGDRVRRGEGGVDVRVGVQWLSFLSPAAAAARYDGIALPPIRPPYMAAIHIGVESIGRALDHLASWQVPYERVGDTAVAVPPEEANGSVLVFVEADA